MGRSGYATILCVAATLCGMSLWAGTHRSSSHPVYFRRAIFTEQDRGSVSTRVIDEWRDPVCACARLRIGMGGVTLLLRGGNIYIIGARRPPLISSDIPEQRRMDDQLYRDLRAGGFPRVGVRLLSKHLGPIAHIVYESHRAIRFNSSYHLSWDISATFWLDARSMVMLREDFAKTGGTVFSDRTLVYRRIMSTELPRGFFDPPAEHATLWEQLGAWLHHR